MSSTALRAKGTLVQIQSGSGATKSASAVAVGYPTIISSTSHGFSNGDTITFNSGFTGADAALLNAQTAIVLYKTTNTYAVGIDTTGKTITAGTGSATGTTYSSLGNAKDFTAITGKTSIITVTNFASAAVEKLSGLPDNGQMTVNLDLDNGDAGQAAAEAARISGTPTAFKIVLPSGTTPTIAFNGIVTGFDNKGQTNGVLQGSLTVEITGAITRS